METNRPLTISAQFGLIDQIDFFKKTVASQDLSSYYLLLNGEFAYNKSYSSEYPWGAIKRLDLYDKGALSSLYICFKPKGTIDSDYLVHYFESSKWHQGMANIAGEGARNHGLLNIAIPDFFNTIHYLPNVSEQRKIADFLNLIEERIAVQNKVIEDLKKLKTALCDRLYDETNPNCRIGEIIEQLSLRNRDDSTLNVLSVSNRYGFISQTEQFEERSIASEDTTNYKVVSLNDFAYNPARINVGSIARNKSTEKGIVSPMYICFRCREVAFPEYLEQFFSTKYFSLEVGKRVEGSVRLCLSFEGLCNIPISLPSLTQQESISGKINAVLRKIQLEENYLSVLSNQKQYLLSHLFI